MRIGFTTPTDAARSLQFDANRSSAGATLTNITFNWNSTVVSQIRAIAGTDTTNKDDGELALFTSASGSIVERLRIDSDGRLLVGTDTARANFNNGSRTAFLQLEGTSSNSIDSSSLALVYNQDSTGNASNIYFAKSKGSSDGSNTALTASDDRLGNISFQGNDGSQFVDAAHIRGFTDGTPGANDMPGRLVFSTTADGASGPTERMRIDSSGKVGIGTTSPVTQLEVKNTSSGVSAALTSNNTSTSELLLGDTDDINIQRIISDHSDNSLQIHTNNSERMRIDSSGDVGIGTTSPGARLELRDNTQALLSWGDTAAIGSLSFDGSSQPVVRALSGKSLVFQTDGSNERARIDSNGILLVGRSAARTNWNDSSIEPKVFIEGAGDNDSTALCVVSNSGSTSGASRGALLTLARTKGTAVGSNTAVDENTALGIIEFKGNDGTSFTTAAKILAACDGTPGTDDMPGRLVFSTSADGSGVPTERMRIDSSGNIGINQSTPTSQSGKVLHISGDDGGQARIHLSTSASGHGANEGSYIIAQGAESGASAGQLSIQNLENRDIIFGTGASGATEKLRIQNAGGISFNGDTAAANALSDYEEGDWTPTFGIGSVTTTDEVYTKIGRLVTLTARITIPSTTNTATVNVGSLPFTADGFMNSAMGGVVGETTLASTDRPVACVESSSNVIRFRQNGATSLTFANLSQVTLRFMVTYFTDQ